MNGNSLKSLRLQAGWTQQAAAEKLGITQAYLSMAERGLRDPSPALARRIAEVFNQPAALPLGPYRRRDRPPGWFQDQLGALGYPGFAYLRAKPEVNPAQLLLEALDSEALDARVVEALPWILAAFGQLNWDWLVSNAKSLDRQNRLGFVLELAKEIARKRKYEDTEQLLAQNLRALETARLATEDTLCERSITQAEVRWLRSERPAAAAKWNLLSDLRPEHMNHA